MDHVKKTIDTYNQLAADYHLTSTPENRVWLEESMRDFVSGLPGKKLLVVGCGEGRDSRFLASLGFSVVSIDLSDGMLVLARSLDPNGRYLKCDLRDLVTLDQKFDGVWACACLYHLTKDEFKKCLSEIAHLLNRGGLLFANLKLGSGEGYIDIPRDGYPGGNLAKSVLVGGRYYAFYRREELDSYFVDFSVEKERRNHIKEGEGAMDFWLRKI